MTEVINGKQIADSLLKEVKEKVEQLKEKNIRPKLAVFLVGDNSASLSYIRLKKKKAEEVGVKVDLHKFDETVSQEDLEKSLKKVAVDDQVHGILVQLPLPDDIDKEKILDLVPLEKDVDSLSEPSKNAVINSDGFAFFPPAARAVLAILDHHRVELQKKNIVIVGTGDLVGRPLAALLLARGVNFELANMYTKNLDELLAKADVVVTGVGKKDLINGKQIKNGAVIIDAGTTGSENGEVTGDVDQDSVMQKASLLSPVPGGVGPVTIAMLLQNVVEAAARSIKT